MSEYRPEVPKPTGRKKPKPKHISEIFAKFENDVVMDSFGKLVKSDEMELTDTVVVEGDLVVTFLDIGQGNCTFIECPGGETILIDCGSVTKNAVTTVGTYAREYITTRLKDNKLDYLIISHPDKDHMNLVDKVLEDVSVGNILCGGAESGYKGSGKNEFKPFVEETMSEKLKQFMINGGNFYSEVPGSKASDRKVQCKGMDVFIVCANADNVDTDKLRTLEITETSKLFGGKAPNTSCIVVRLEYRKQSIMICGDATFSTEYVMLNGPWSGKLKTDALEGGHHGSADSFSDKFLQAVDPSWIHFSADNKGTFRHPTWEVVNRVTSKCKQIMASRDFGPHGIVIGPDLNTGLSKKGGNFFEPSPRIKTVFDLMKEKNLSGKEALKLLLPKWEKEGDFKKGETKPQNPIEEQWLAELLGDSMVRNSVDTELVAYWGKTFDDYAAEAHRLADEKDDIDAFKYYWDWSVIDFNLFTTLTTANLGVYWILTVDADGNMTTELA